MPGVGGWVALFCASDFPGEKGGPALTALALWHGTVSPPPPRQHCNILAVGSSPMSLISSSPSPDLPDPAATREGGRGDVIAIADVATVAQGLLGTLLAGYGRVSDPSAPTCSAQVEGRGLLSRWVQEAEN